MKYRLPIPLPRRADHSLLPAVCAGALLAMVALQLAVPRAVPLPEPGVVRPFSIDTAQPARIGVDPAILARPIFAGGTGGATVAQGPVDGATAIGVMNRAGARIAFVQGGDGAVVSLRPGDLYHGWRLRAIDRDAIVFDRGGQSASLPVTTGGAAHPAATPSTTPANATQPPLQPIG